MLWSAAILVLALAVHQATPLQVTPDYAENIDNKAAWDARIVSGWRANPGDYPHMISMRMVNRIGGVQGCGGSVMSRRWILTAAHCTATQITILIRAGVTNLTRPEFFTETQEYYMYPTFNAATPQAVQPNDIAVVKLPIALTYSKYLKPIRIQSSADAHRNYNTLITQASGFGRTWTNGPQTEHLLWVYLRAISNQACTDLFTSRFVTDNTICAQFFNVTSQSICQGDSGGPLVHLSPQGEQILIGVSSFVAREPHGCHSGIPAAFIRPGPFHSWFTQITGIDFENLIEEDETTTTTAFTSTTPRFTSTTTNTTQTSTTSRPTSTTTNATLTSTTSRPTTPTIPVPTSTTNTTLFPSSTTMQRPTSTTTTTNTVTVAPTTVTTIAPTTTPITNTTTPEPEEEDIDDPELEDLLKRLEVRVKVKVRLSKYLKKKKQIEH